MHSLMSSLDLLEHVVPVAAMAWAGVDVLDALPHPASAMHMTVMASVMRVVFLILFPPSVCAIRRWRIGSIRGSRF
jgi:hypothetical protein